MSIIKSLYPNVPDAPGVPLVLRSTGTTYAAVALSKVQGEIWRRLTTENRWGLFTLDGALYLDADTVLEVGVSSTSKVSSHPVQQGAFASYNKVQEPNRYTIRMAKGGRLGFVQGGRLSLKPTAEQARREFLGKLEAAKEGTQLFTVVTPERVYRNCCLENYSYRRETTDGAYMIVAELSLIEVREVTPKYTTQANPLSNTQSPNGASPVDSGRVNPTPAPKQSALRAGGEQVFGYIRKLTGG